MRESIDEFLESDTKELEKIHNDSHGNKPRVNDYQPISKDNLTVKQINIQIKKFEGETEKPMDTDSEISIEDMKQEMKKKRSNNKEKFLSTLYVTRDRVSSNFVKAQPDEDKRSKFQRKHILDLWILPFYFEKLIHFNLI